MDNNITSPLDAGVTTAICQHCGQEVIWDRHPVDASYAAFTHTNTGLIACTL